MYSRLISSISLSSCFLAQYPNLLRRDELLDKNRSLSNFPLLRTLSYSDHNNRPQKNSQFFFCFPGRVRPSFNVQIWKSTSKFGRVRPNFNINFLVMIKLNHFLHCLQVGTTSLLLYRCKKSLNTAIPFSAKSLASNFNYPNQMEALDLKFFQCLLFVKPTFSQFLIIDEVFVKRIVVSKLTEKLSLAGQLGKIKFLWVIKPLIGKESLAL